MIDQGRLTFVRQLQRLRQRVGGERELVVDSAEDYADVAIEGAEVAAREGRRVTYRFRRHGAAGLTASALIGRLLACFPILDLSLREPVIEATIWRIYEERLLDHPEAAARPGQDLDPAVAGRAS